MTTPGKNQSSKRAPQHNETKELDEEESVPMSSELDDELDDEDDEGDRIPAESVEDQETGRADRDADRGGRGQREP